MSSPNTLRELPSLAEWLKASNLSVWDYLAVQGSAELTLAHASLYWPEFVEVDDCVLLRERYDAVNFREWLDHLNHDRVRVEGMINHVHLWDLLGQEQEALPEAALEAFAKVLMSSWKCALRQQFPDREFDVRLEFDDSEYGPTLSFSSVR